MIRRLLKYPMWCVMALLMIVVLNEAATSSRQAYARVLSSLPMAVRRQYLAYVLDPRIGFFRSHTEKTLALEYLADRVKQAHDASDVDSRGLIRLLRETETIYEPIPEISGYVLVLMNRKEDYRLVFDTYRSEPDGISVLYSSAWTLRETDPQLYPVVARALDETEGAPCTMAQYARQLWAAERGLLGRPEAGQLGEKACP